MATNNGDAMTMVAENKKLTGADAKFGYVFGCEGLMTVEQTCDMLSLTRWSLDKLHERGVIRKGKLSRKAVRFCRRSVREYLATLEVK